MAGTVSQYTCTLQILEFQRTVSIETSTTTTISFTSHGLSTGDFIVNTTRRGASLGDSERGSRRVTVVDANNMTITPAITGQTASDIVALFKFTDRTAYLLDGTLSINLRAEGQNEASFTLISQVQTTEVGNGYVFGGVQTGGERSNQEYTQVSDTWATKTSLSAPSRSQFSSCTLSGKGYVFNGVYSTTIHADNDEYDKNSDVWTAKTDVVSPNRYDNRCCDLNNKGYNVAGQGPTSTWLTDNDEYDSSGNSWANKTSIVSPARDAGSIININQKGYYWGGANNLGLKQDNDEYDQSGDSWASKTNITNLIKWQYSMTLNGYGYSMGGLLNAISHKDYNYQYDASGDSWATKTVVPSPLRAKHGGFPINNLGYLAYGYQYPSAGAIKDCDEYNPIGDAWTAKTDGNTPTNYSVASTVI